MLPYFLGCPSWSEPAWRGALYPDSTRSADFLPLYASLFNAVEGNTTFYARPSPQTVARWAELMPADFRFCAKLPRDISHTVDLREHLSAAEDFVRLLAPLGDIRLQGVQCGFSVFPRLGGQHLNALGQKHCYLALHLHFVLQIFNAFGTFEQLDF